MTRRVIIPQPVHVEVCSGEATLYRDKDNEIPWKYQVGDKLWVRETFSTGARNQEPFGIIYKADGTSLPNAIERGTYVAYAGWGKWKPSIFMPRWASRITQTITESRVERLQEISYEDAKAEGFISISDFAIGWDSLFAKRGYSWESNSWVWVISYPAYKGLVKE